MPKRPPMNLEKIEFLCSSPSLAACPKQDLPEFAFIGRSNVGKSSLINMLAGIKGLAKVSGTPGKTRLINHFLVGSGIGDVGSGMRDKKNPTSHISHHKSASWFLVDLPGFGFAKLSKAQRETFEGMIKNYLQKRENLVCTYLLIDARLEAQQIDLDFMNWLGDNDVSFIILFTKTDKLSKTQLAANLAAYQKKLSESWYELPLMLLTSSETRAGREEVLGSIGEMLGQIAEGGE